MKLNDRYIKATLAGIPYLLPYGQLIAAPAPATRLNDSGSLLWDGILEGDSREELLALLADRYHTTERERAALAEDVDQYLHSLCRMGILLADTPESRGDDTPPLFYRIGPLVFSYRGPSLLYDRFFSAFSCEEEYFDQEVLILTGKPASIPYGAVLIHTEELTICDSGSSYCFFFAAPWGIREMHVKKDGSRAVLYRMPDPDDMHIEDLFHALRFAFLILAQQKELYVLHSASFLYRGRAFLVSGSSGTGKSTHSALWHDLYQTPLLNGDLNLRHIGHLHPERLSARRHHLLKAGCHRSGAVPAAGRKSAPHPAADDLPRVDKGASPSQSAFFRSPRPAHLFLPSVLHKRAFRRRDLKSRHRCSLEFPHHLTDLFLLHLHTLLLPDAVHLLTDGQYRRAVCCDDTGAGLRGAHDIPQHSALCCDV